MNPTTRPRIDWTPWVLVTVVLAVLLIALPWAIRNAPLLVVLLAAALTVAAFRRGGTR